MIKSILHQSIAKFEDQYNYDAGYMHDINNISSSAAFRLMLLGGMNGYIGNDLSVWGGAALSGTLQGDCGPCAQLMIDKILERGVQADVIAACLQNDWETSGSMGVGFRFATALLNNHSNLETLRSQIKQMFGDQALIAASFAATSYLTYPLIKRALGHAQVCTSLNVGKLSISPNYDP